MKKANRLFIITLSAVSVCILTFTAGCKDNPQNEAAREARADLDLALQMIDTYSLEGGFN